MLSEAVIDDALRESLNHWTQWRTAEDAVGEVNRKLKGWGGYFHHGNSTRVFARMNDYARRRLGLWLWRYGTWGKTVALACLVGALSLGSWRALDENGARATVAAEGRVAWSEQALAELRASGTPVFVDVTADWCITCKVNEKAVLHTEAFTRLLKDTGTVYMVGDWTNQDPEISVYLDQYNTPGVPLYVVYPKGPGEGRKLPQLLTFPMMRKALAP